MQRRTVVATIAAGVLAAAASLLGGEALGGEFGRLTGGGLGPQAERRPVPDHLAAPIALPQYFPAARITRVPLPHGAIYSLPGPGRCVALTVDDGHDSEVVRLYAEFARLTGMRITFFLNGSWPSWTDNARVLRPLVESGQIQLGNHTWSHPNLQKLTDAEIAAELTTNHDFITKTYGVDARPYYRPPFGFHDARVDAVASGLGYWSPVLWYGSLSDSSLITVDQLKAFATSWMLPQHIVIGHANFPPVTHCFDFLADLIRERTLQPVTLDDYFAR